LQSIGRGKDRDVRGNGLSLVELDATASILDEQGACRAGDDGKRDIGPALNRLEQALAHIFAEQLPRQEGVGERLMQARVVLSLVELTKGPVQEIARLPWANREIAGAHIEKIERVMAAIGNAAPKRGGALDHREPERSLDMREASDRGGGAREAATDYAHR
jgi:hypothetical protein